MLAIHPDKQADTASLRYTESDRDRTIEMCARIAEAGALGSSMAGGVCGDYAAQIALSIAESIRSLKTGDPPAKTQARPAGFDALRADRDDVYEFTEAEGGMPEGGGL